MLAEKFSHIKKFKGTEGNRVVARILPGEYYVTSKDEVITTVLGSCISACIYDPLLNIGGMNHFMLPASDDAKTGWSGSEASSENRYGNFAMESLINELLSMGASKARLEVKIFGGGKILEAMTDIGKRNIDFALSYVAIERLKMLSKDVGDRFPRKVNYYPTTGKVKVKKLRALYGGDIARREQQFVEEIKKVDVTGEMELF